MDTDDAWNGLFGGDRDPIFRRMERLFSGMEGLGGSNAKTCGYAMYWDSDGNNLMREFGNPADSLGTQSEMAGEPLTDVSLEDGAVRAVVEIPGVSKEDIRLEGSKNALCISVDTENKRFARTLALPCDVDPDSAKAEYNNGMLEVILVPIVAPEQRTRIGIM